MVSGRVQLQWNVIAAIILTLFNGCMISRTQDFKLIYYQKPCLKHLLGDIVVFQETNRNLGCNSLSCSSFSSFNSMFFCTFLSFCQFSYCSILSNTYLSTVDAILQPSKMVAWARNLGMFHSQYLRLGQLKKIHHPVVLEMFWTIFAALGIIMQVSPHSCCKVFLVL